MSGFSSNNKKSKCRTTEEAVSVAAAAATASGAVGTGMAVASVCILRVRGVIKRRILICFILRRPPFE
jgi:hypothetical protein